MRGSPVDARRGRVAPLDACRGDSIPLQAERAAEEQSYSDMASTAMAQSLASLESSLEDAMAYVPGA